MGKQGIFYDVLRTTEKEWDAEQWRERGREIRRAGRTKRQDANQLQWDIGDWLVAGKSAISLSDRKLWQEATRITGYPRGTLKNFLWISSKFPKGSSRRRDGVSWSHHREVARLPEAEQDALLEKWGKRSLRELKAAIREYIRKEVIAEESARRAKAYEAIGAQENTPTEEPVPIQMTFTIKNSEIFRFLWANEKQVHGGQKTVEEMIFWLIGRGLKSVDGWSEKGSALWRALNNASFLYQHRSIYQRHLKPKSSKQAES